MKSNPIDGFLDGLPEERKAPVAAVIEALRSELPSGFMEHSDGRMVHFSVPHSRYPDGYHCNPKAPLPFISVASTKGHVSLHHLGLYAHPPLLEALQVDWDSADLGKLNMGKGCVRFKRMAQLEAAIPILKLTFARMSLQAWIDCYEAEVKR